jgi:pimeloyl-ACP methyl ester carboxylesterase
VSRFSDRPAQPGWGVERIADAWVRLMGRLGYARYGAQGGDWGTSISASIAQQDPEHVAGIHLNPPLAAPDPATFEDLTEAERAALAALEHAAEWDSGYSQEHATRPQTIGYALVDSPTALCAWIVEKFWAWTDCDGHPENVLTRDELLDNLMLYWLPGTGASSARLYGESVRQVNRWITGPTTDTVAVPTGCSIYPKELQRPSRRWAAKRFLDIRYWNELDRGGHFAAFEQPDLFVDELRSFFRLVR